MSFGYLSKKPKEQGHDIEDAFLICSHCCDMAIGYFRTTRGLEPLCAFHEKMLLHEGEA